MSTRPVREALSVITDEGFAIDSVRLSKHLVVKASHPSGVTATFVTALTPSDVRGIRNLRARVRRALKVKETA